MIWWFFMNRPIDLNQYFQTRGHRPRSAFSGGRRWKSVVWECLETRPRVCRFVLVKSALIEIRWIQISDLTTGLTVLYLKRLRTDCIDLRQRNSQISMFSGKPRPRVFWVCLSCKENPTVWIARWHEWPESSSKRIHSDTMRHVTQLHCQVFRLHQSDCATADLKVVCLPFRFCRSHWPGRDLFEKLIINSPRIHQKSVGKSHCFLGLRPWCGLDFQEKNVAQTSEPEK